MSPEDLNARLLYRDALMLVLDKPAGIAVHKGPKGGDNLESHFHALRFGLPRTPSLAHRLDRDTSGCLVLGRHRKALEKLGLMFKQGKIDKAYWAIVEGRPATSPEGADLTWLELEPLTGRTHQLRVHCAAMGWPILGDPIYGAGLRDGGPPLHLHARSITIPLYKNKGPIRCEAPVPPHMQAALVACGFVESEEAQPPVLAEAAP